MAVKKCYRSEEDGEWVHVFLSCQRVCCCGKLRVPEPVLKSYGNAKPKSQREKKVVKIDDAELPEDAE